MKNISLILTCLILASCVSKKEITKSETEKTEINKVRIDTIIKDKIIHETEFFTNEILIPCDSAKLKQSFKIGKNAYKIIKEKGEVKIVFKRDSSRSICESQYKVLITQNDSLKTKLSTFNKEVIKKPFLSDFWKIAFFIILILWILGITPLFIFRMIKRLIVP